jgi:Zn-dependent protease
MFTSWRLGRVLGFPVEINLSFVLLLVAVLFGFGGFGDPIRGLFVIGLVFGSVLVHELGHALVARRYGVHVSGIELSFFGGAAKMVQMPRSADHEIAIAAAGPAVSLMIAGVGLGLGGLHFPLIGGWLAEIGWINLGLAIFNLIPALPMDGGRILRAVLTRRMDFVRATDIAVDVARVVAIGFGVIGLLLPGWLMLLVLAPLLWIMGSRERMLARAMVDQYAGYGRSSSDPFDRWGRASTRFDRPSSFGPGGRGPGGFRGDPSGARDPGERPRRYTVRQVGGRLVIESID